MKSRECGTLPWMGRSLRGGFPRWDFSTKLRFLRISNLVFFSDSGEILRHAVGQLRKAAAATARNSHSKSNSPPCKWIPNLAANNLSLFRNLNEAVILTEAPSGETATAREGARSQKKSISSAKEILSPLEEEIFFVFQRNRFLAEKKSEESKGRSEATAGHNLFCKSQFSVTDLIKLSSSMQKMLVWAITPLLYLIKLAFCNKEKTPFIFKWTWWIK